MQMIRMRTICFTSQIVIICCFCLFARVADGQYFPDIGLESEDGYYDFETATNHSHTAVKRAAGQTVEFKNHSHSSQIKVPQGYSIHDPPPEVGKATRVDFSVLLFSVRDIKEISEELSLELRLQLSWKDSRLTEWKDYIEPGEKYTVLNPKIMDKLWYPDIFIDYVKSIAQPVLLSKPASLRFYNDSSLRFSTRITITMSCPMAFHYYPADTQKCNIDMKSYAYNDNQLKLDWRTKAPLVMLRPESDMEMPNFKLELAKPAEIVVQTSAGFYSGIRFTVLLRRSMKFHLIQTYLPSTLFVIVSWLSFLVPPEMVPGRMAICMTTLLTLTAMFAAVRQNIPKVSYIKALDIWMVTCACFVFFTLLEYTIVLKLRAMREIAEKKKALMAAKFAAAVISQESNAGKPRTGEPNLEGQSQNHGNPQTVEPPPRITDQLIEKYTWMVVVGLFFIFNCVYWPWLLALSGYYDRLGDTKYYGE